MLLVLAACSGDDRPRPIVPDELTLEDEHLWSEPDAVGDQHHATVAVLADGKVAVAWTDGEIALPDELGRIRRITPLGLAEHAPIPLDSGVGAAKPDVVALPDGRALVGYQSDEGLFLERVDVTSGEREATVLAPLELANGNSSVDLALRSDGTTLAVWYDQDPPLGSYRASAFDPGFEVVAALPALVAETEDLAPSTPDVDVDPDGVAAVAWVDQRAGAVYGSLHGTVLLDAYAPDGVLRWRTELASGDGPDSPRRATAVSFPDGRVAVGWRARADVPPVPTRIVLAFLTEEGALLKAPFTPVDGDTDDLVIARVGDAALWLAWTGIHDPVESTGTVFGGLLSFPEGEWIVAPVELSGSRTAGRPHVDAAQYADRRWRIAVSWEELDTGGVRSVHGRTATVR